MTVRHTHSAGMRGAAIASLALGLMAFGAACSSSSDSGSTSSSSSTSATTTTTAVTTTAVATTTHHPAPPPVTTTAGTTTTYDKSGQPCVATGGVPGYWVNSGGQWICKLNPDVPTAPTSILTGVTPPTSILTGVTPPSNLTGANPPN